MFELIAYIVGIIIYTILYQTWSREQLRKAQRAHSQFAGMLNVMRE